MSDYSMCGRDGGRGPRVKIVRDYVLGLGAEHYDS